MFAIFPRGRRREAEHLKVAITQRNGRYRKAKVKLIQPGSTSRLHTSWNRGYL